MKQIIIALIALISFGSCRHECPEPEVSTIELIPGTWQYEDGRTFTIGEQDDRSFPVTFPFRIASPVQQPITLAYAYSGYDTVRLLSGNIYPDAYFYVVDGEVRGMMEEYVQGPGLGEYVMIVKVE